MGEKAMQGFLAATGKTGERINDAVGGVFPRTLAMIINEAAFAVQESVASAADIDTAMKLGARAALGRGDDGTAVAGTQIHHHVRRPDLGDIHHLVDRDLRGRQPDHVLALLAGARLERRGRSAGGGLRLRSSQPGEGGEHDNSDAGWGECEHRRAPPGFDRRQENDNYAGACAASCTSALV